MKRNKNIIIAAVYAVALPILIFSSLFNPPEKYIVAILLVVSFPFAYQKFRTITKGADHQESVTH